MAERAIQTFKNHFIVGLASVSKNFPVHLWCRLIPHCLLTFNLLCPSIINPKLSAYAQINSALDFKCTPLAPPGTKVIIHDKPSIRGSWSKRGYEGCYIGPALNHYRCHTVYSNHTAHERVDDTVEFLPNYGKMPYRSSTENATIAVRELTHALQNTSPDSPFSNVGDKQMEAHSSNRQTFQQSVTKKISLRSAPGPLRL